MSDRLPICEMCRNFPGEYNFCPITARCCRDDYLYECCSDFEQKPNTVFDRITQSPEVLAPKFVYEYTLNPPASDGTTKLFHSLLTDKNYYTEAEAIAARWHGSRRWQNENGW